MADVRCPMCSKNNPQEAEICMFCGARLKPLRPGTAGFVQPGEHTEPLFDSTGEEEPDWLRDLREGDEPESAPGEAAPEQQQIDSDETPDWLARIRDRERSEPEAEQPPLTWERDNSEPQRPVQTGSLGGDWVGRLPGSTDAPDQFPTEPAPTQPEETASSGDWNWLQELDANDPFLGSSSSEGQDSSDTAAFLSQLESEEQTRADQPSSGGLHGLGLTDFLNRVDEPQPPAAAANDAEPVPEWLKTGPIPPAQRYSDFHDVESAAEPLPDWLQGGTQSEDAGSRPEQPALEPLPDLFSNVEAAEPVPPTFTPAQGADEPVHDVPDWLLGFEQATEAGGETPSAPQQEETRQPELSANGGVPPFADIDLPDWLAEETEQPVALVPAEDRMESGEALAQAELPDWVKEMRPIESVIPGDLEEETGQQMERSGPLAGMRGVIPAESALGQLRKPPVYASRLRVTEKQHDQVALLENILATELQPLRVAARRKSGSRRLSRAVVALLLLLALLVPRLMGLEPLGVPALYPAELLDMREGIERNLQQGSTVLLAVDFEPALSGEMTLAAGPVIQHLMANDAQIVVVSTTPSGPALAQQLLDRSARDAASAGNRYELANRAVNLGYLPGGPVSVMAFAELPAQAAPAALSGDPNIWQEGFLQTIRGIQDFSQVILLTDSGESARAWVEQVQPLMGTVPLYVVASAQAAPLLMPYVETRQMSGLLSGALGGAMYEQSGAQAANQPPPQQEEFASYQFASLFGALLVLAAGAVSAVRGLIKRPAKEEG